MANLTARLYPGDVFSATGVTAVTSTSFTLGTDSMVNQSGVTYYYAAFENNAGKYKAGKYGGTGSAVSVTGLGFTPAMVWVIPTGDRTPYMHAPRSAGDRGQTFEGPVVGGFFTSMDSDGFTVTSLLSVSSPATDYYWVAWAEVDEYFKGIAYSGNSIDGRVLTGAGFAPDLAMVKTAHTAVSDMLVVRFAGNVGDQSAEISEGTAFSTNRIQEFEADGAEVGNDISVNTSDFGFTYNGMFFKSQANYLAQGTYVGTGATQTITTTVAPTSILFKGGTNGAAIYVSDTAPTASVNLTANIPTVFTLSGTLTGVTSSAPPVVVKCKPLDGPYVITAVLDSR